MSDFRGRHFRGDVIGDVTLTEVKHAEGGFEKLLGIEACAVIPFFRFWLEE